MGNVYLWSGVIFTATAVALLLLLFAPARRLSRVAPNISATGKQGTKFRVTISPIRPSIFSRHAVANVVISGLPTIETLAVEWPAKLKNCNVLFAELSEQPDGSFAQPSVPVVPTKSTDSSYHHYTIDAPFIEGSGREWMLMMGEAVRGRRVAFGAYHFSLPLSLSEGNWTSAIAELSDYDIVGGQKEDQIVAGKPDSNGLLTGFLDADFTVKFIVMESWRDLFSILFSTILGLGLALIVEGVKLSLG